MFLGSSRVDGELKFVESWSELWKSNSRLYMKALLPYGRKNGCLVRALVHIASLVLTIVKLEHRLCSGWNDNSAIISQLWLEYHDVQHKTRIVFLAHCSHNIAFERKSSSSIIRLGRGGGNNCQGWLQDVCLQSSETLIWKKKPFIFPESLVLFRENWLFTFLSKRIVVVFFFATKSCFHLLWVFFFALCVPVLNTPLSAFWRIQRICQLQFLKVQQTVETMDRTTTLCPSARRMERRARMKRNPSTTTFCSWSSTRCTRWVHHTQHCVTDKNLNFLNAAF